MIVVADTSILFKTLVTEPDSDRAGSLVASSRVVVPELVYAEIGNAIWNRVHDRRLAQEAAVDLIEVFNSAAFEVHSNRPHLRRALAIAAAIDHPVYDCICLSLAESLGIPLVTEDTRFLRALSRHGFQPADVKRLIEVT
ncbi:MAG: type II toxin-antitoxin system VapC family toxin [Xanthobacteraceae bacterium]